MKKIYSLSLLLACTGLMGTAQIKKGAILLGGQLSYNSNSNAYWNVNQPNQTNQKSSGGNFNIAIGKAFKENTVTGVNIGFGSSKSDNFYNGSTYYNSHSNQYNLGLFYRKYKKLSGDFYFFGEGCVGFFSNKQTNTDIPLNNKTIIKGLGGNLFLTPGISYKICKKLQIEITMPGILNANYISYKAAPQTSNPNQKQFAISSSLNGTLLNSVGFGFRFVL